MSLYGGEYRNRTGVHGVADRCVTTLPTRPRPVINSIQTHLQE